MDEAWPSVPNIAAAPDAVCVMLNAVGVMLNAVDVTLIVDCHYVVEQFESAFHYDTR